MSTCATESDMLLRLSTSFRLNVLAFNLITLLTFIFSIQAIHKILKNAIFSRTVQVMFTFNLIFYNIHAIYLSIVMTWSTYRGFIQAADPCKIMFEGAECYGWFIFGVVIRCVLIYSQVVLTVERLVTYLFPASKPLLNAYILNLLGVLGGLVTAYFMTAPHISKYTSTSCFQQKYIDYNTVQNMTWIMFICGVVCLVLNYWILHQNKSRISKNSSEKMFDLASRFKNNNNMYSSITVSIIILIQTLFYSFYAFYLSFFYNREFLEVILPSASRALWLYMIPYAGLALPISITISINKIVTSRSLKIEQLRKTSQTQDNHFRDLMKQWK